MSHENDVCVVTRVFRKTEEGKLSEKDLSGLTGKVADLQNLQGILENFREPIIVSTSDLPETGRKKLEVPGHRVVYANTTAADPSNSSLLNTAIESAEPDIGRFLIVSLSLAHDEKDAEEKKSELAARQIKALGSLFDHWKEKPERKLAMTGSLILGEQNLDLIEEAINPSGKRDISLDNLGVAFPNFSLAMIRRGIRISEDTDNGMLGRVWIKSGEKEETARVGGNEDFYEGFRLMLEGEDVVLLIDPYMPGERHDKVIVEDTKYRRRMDVYKIYATELIMGAVRRGKISGLEPKDLSLDYIEKIVEETIDKHLFYARIYEDGSPEVLLTRRQLLK